MEHPRDNDRHLTAGDTVWRKDLPRAFHPRALAGQVPAADGTMLALYHTAKRYNLDRGNGVNRNVPPPPEVEWQAAGGKPFGSARQTRNQSLRHRTNGILAKVCAANDARRRNDRPASARHQLHFFYRGKSGRKFTYGGRYAPYDMQQCRGDKKTDADSDDDTDEAYFRAFTCKLEKCEDDETR